MSLDAGQGVGHLFQPGRLFQPTPFPIFPFPITRTSSLRAHSGFKMKTRHLLIIVAFLVFTLTSPCKTEADVVLGFDPHPGNGASVDQDYGDRVTALNQNGFLYGQTEPGFTPNIVVTYDDDLFHWDSSYGDLTNVLYTNDNEFKLKLGFDADDGFDVILHGFDLAGWPSTDYTIPLVAVSNGFGSTLFAQTDVLVHGDSIGPPRTQFEFNSPIRASNLNIEISTGVAFDSIGIDNIRFSQAVMVPEPSFGLPILACATVGCLSRRRKNRIARVSSCYV